MSAELFKLHVECEKLLSSIPEIDYDDDVSYYSLCLRESLADIRIYYDDVSHSLDNLQKALQKKEEKYIEMKYNRNPYCQSDFI